MKRGYFGIGIQNTKTEMNVGTLWRSAHILGAAFIFTIGHRYKRQSSDTTKAWKTIPLYHFTTFDDFYKSMPHDCMLIGVELDERAIGIEKFYHPERCIYLLGTYCLNVAVAGSIVMYDRLVDY